MNNFASPTRSWFGVCVQFLLLLLLSLYGAGLIFAAWPSGDDFGPLKPLHVQTRSLIHSLKFRAGVEVFAGNRGLWKRRSLCVTVAGTDDTANSRTLYESYPNCITPDLRVLEDPFFVLLMRAGHTSEMKRFLGASEKDTKKELKNLRESGRLDRVSNYFCDSPLVENEGVVNVDLLWQVEQIHYKTGKIRQDLFHAHSYNCRTKRSNRSAFKRFSIAKNESGGLYLEDTRQSVEVTKEAAE